MNIMQIAILEYAYHLIITALARIALIQKHIYVLIWDYNFKTVIKIILLEKPKLIFAHCKMSL